tara:strand:- start:3081 stop:3488 length:408 start_codon:yes stop_codon:yes gene_type:complete
MFKVYDHWKEVPNSWAAWSWKYFQPKELACKGTGKLKISVDLLDSLEALRSKYASSLLVLSAFRSKYHNAKVGGAVFSRHLVGDACDISIVNRDKLLIEKLAKEFGFTGIGYYKTFIHIDRRPKKARWGREKWNV